MKVILLENIKNLGTFGDIVKVAKGFARNYLVPFGKAVPAVPENVAEFEKEREKLAAKAQLALDKAQERAQAIEAIGVIKLPVRASEEGKLYGSVSNSEIAQAYTSKNVEVRRQEIKLHAGVIRELGVFSFDIQLHSSLLVSAEIEVINSDN